MENIKHRIGLIFNDNTPKTKLKNRIGNVILFLILLSSAQIILESISFLNLKFKRYFEIIDVTVSVLFSLEYFLRIWTYKLNNNKPTFKQRLSHIFSFYMMVDLISIIPFFASIFISTEIGFLRIFRILRLVRILKFGRYMKSQNLVINAIRNKGKELILSIQIVFFLTVILSAIMYQIEKTVQPENFGDIIDAFLWSLSKFIGGIGGYGDFTPITLWGQFIATVVGILGIALFAIPAGIIGAGFVEEIENLKNDEDLKAKNNILLAAFNNETQASAIKSKRIIGLSHIRRRFIPFASAEFKLMLSRDDLINIANKGKGIRLTKVNGEEVIQSFEENTIYGTLLDRNSEITIISSSAATQQFLGHFTYAISEYLNANYICSELVSKSVWDPKYRASLYSNPHYLGKEKSENIYFDRFKQDMLDTVVVNSTVIYFLCSASKNGSFHILNGGKKGDNKFTNKESTFNNVDKLESFYNDFQKSLKKIDKTDKKIFSTVNKHKFYGNYLKDRFHWYLRNEKNVNVVCIYLSPTILESNPEEYYSIIKILGDSINKNLL